MEKELENWLRRTEKTFTENLQFALKAWQSSEFTLPTKYDVILDWLVEELPKISATNTLPVDELKELFKLRVQPALSKTETKTAFVSVMLKTFHIDRQKEEHTNRDIPEILRLLLEYELLQDYYRFDPAIYARVFGALIKQYELYIISLKGEIQLNKESEFIFSTINVFKENANRTSKLELFATAYTHHALAELVELQLTLRQYQLDIFKDVLEIEKITGRDYNDDQLFERVLLLPPHVKLFALECSLINRRSSEPFQKTFLDALFFNLKPKDMTKDDLIVASFTMGILRRNDIALISSAATKSEMPLAKIGECLVVWVEHCKSQHLREVLLLLCATLRYNPLILEQHIFKITTWMIVASKEQENNEHTLFEEYLKLLLDMIRRLSRAEKFVTHLLKALKEWLESNNLPAQESLKKKRKSVANAVSPRKLMKQCDGIKVHTGDAGSVDYMQILIRDLEHNDDKINLPANLTHVRDSFPYLQNYWPSECVGIAFSKIVTGLMSKPSLTVWKSICFALRGQLTELGTHSTDAELKSNQLFLLDMHATLFCQYFNGTKLVEHTSKFLTQINEARVLTADLLSIFGRLLLAREHEKRLISAFLECCHSFGNFELMLLYYRPDGLEDNSLDAHTYLKQIHSYLAAEEWSLLQQRVWNFGKSRCKYLLNRLLLQRYEGRQLLTKPAEATQSIDFMKILTGEDHNISLELSLKYPSAGWLIATRQRHEKQQLAELVFDKPALFTMFHDDLETVELVALKLFETATQAMQSSTKKSSLVNAINFDFAQIRQGVDATVTDTHMKSFAEIIMQRPDNYQLKALPISEIEATLAALEQLPIAYIRRPMKWFIFILFLVYYRDLLAAADHVHANQVYTMLIDFLHFGQHLAICKYFKTQSLMQLLPLESCLAFYEYLFATIKAEEKGTTEFLTSLTQLLTQNEQKLSNEERKLLLFAIDTLTNSTGSVLKCLRPHLKKLLNIYGNYVRAHFDKVDNVAEGSNKHRKFVEKTLSGYAPYANALLTNQPGKDKDTEPTPTLTDEFRLMTKIYIGHSIDYRNPHAIRLIKVALNHREKLQLDQAEIELILSSYWRQLNADLMAGKTPEPKNAAAVVKLIIDNKTNEDFLLILKDLESQLVHGEVMEKSADVADVKIILSLLTLIGKCQLSTIKGAIFNEQFKQITTSIAMNMVQDERQRFTNYEHVHAMLTCQKVIVENKMVPLTTDTLDSILAFLIDINIKKYELTDTNMTEFKTLHLAMCELCESLLKQRHLLLMDRISQFMQIFKELLQCIVWFKSERQKDITLAPAELDDLSELALKLATLMSHIATHSLHVKRIAPFVLTYIINLMVSDRRPTTLYTKIKTHIESICYDLIGICDHRSGHFILRCSSEAGRQLYELLLKDHKKYHKFKGKV